MFSILFGCTGKEDENESTKLVKVPSSGAFSKTNEVKTWRYAHELSDTLTVTNDGITNITGINTIALRMETSNGCAVKYYYFENGQCKIHAAKGKLFFMAKKKVIVLMNH